MKRFPTTMLLAALIAAPAMAQEGGDATSLAKTAQNPIAAMISVRFQYNINHRPDREARRPANEPAGRGVLQRRASGCRGQMADPAPRVANVPEMSSA